MLYIAPNSNLAHFLSNIEDTFTQNMTISYAWVILTHGGVYILLFQHLIKAPIHVYNMTLIDLFLTNMEGIIDSGVINAGIADHFLIHFKIKLKNILSSKEIKLIIDQLEILI